MGDSRFAPGPAPPPHHEASTYRVWIGRELGEKSVFSGYAECQHDSKIVAEGEWDDPDAAIQWAKGWADWIVVMYNGLSSRFSAGREQVYDDDGSALPPWPPDASRRAELEEQARREADELGGAA